MGVDFATQIYILTESFPKDEKFGLVSQIQRAAVSISSNVAEGHGRDSDKEFDRFLRIAIGSACEIDTQLEIAYRLSYINLEQKDSLKQDLDTILKSLYSLRKAINERIQRNEQLN